VYTHDHRHKLDTGARHWRTHTMTRLLFAHLITLQSRYGRSWVSHNENSTCCLRQVSRSILDFSVRFFVHSSTLAIPPAPLCTAMHRDAPRCTAMHRDAPRCTAMHRDVPRCTAMHRYTPLCTAVHRLLSAGVPDAFKGEDITDTVLGTVGLAFCSVRGGALQATHTT
jgi:hypothetical protein